MEVDASVKRWVERLDFASWRISPLLPVYIRDCMLGMCQKRENCEGERVPGCYFPANECRFEGCLPEIIPYKYVDTVAFAVDVKSVQKSTGAGLYASDDCCQKNSGIE
ncbi:hypothetical protein RF11_13644 [Thelohanellus kitauei]|uniref:Uncharacterized protein n=1 Tax=Thelohanellus kitauei TaxID=669202 RepID=A0A0C2J3T7_THEKT|nr:hypothetical protein RF11_13644 [Thelohanellus kitauei]